MRTKIVKRRCFGNGRWWVAGFFHKIWFEHSDAINFAMAYTFQRWVELGGFRPNPTSLMHRKNRSQLHKNHATFTACIPFKGEMCSHIERNEMRKTKASREWYVRNLLRTPPLRNEEHKNPFDSIRWLRRESLDVLILWFFDLLQLMLRFSRGEVYCTSCYFLHTFDRFSLLLIHLDDSIFFSFALLCFTSRCAFSLQFQPK